MKKLTAYFVGSHVLVITAIAALILLSLPDQEEPYYAPGDWLLAQRMYPYGHLNPDAYENSRQQMLAAQDELLRMKSGGEEWKFAGPLNVVGRVSDVEMHPADPNTIYACAASGGIYKSVDQGKEWEQIFDGYATLSIGDMAVAEADKRILYVGTGEPNGGNGSLTYDGYGVYKSVDEGVSFTHVGLENAGGIGKVIIDPDNPDRVFVAAMGNLFSNNPERGVYRTTDGGTTWENVLYISDSTGAIDLVMHPTNTDIVYASMWERKRYATHRFYGGQTSGLYRSTDGGDTWEELTNGLPSGEISRIGIALCESQPNVMYAHYSDTDRNWIDLFKSTDGGDSWVATNSNIEGNYWEGKVHVDPTNPDILWSLGVYMHYSDDGAESWRNVSGSDFWVDQHAVYVHPMDNQLVVLGNDGGVYVSTDGSSTQYKPQTLPITQFYSCEANYQHPEDIMGGTQDRGTQRSESGDPMEWESIKGGDGFIVRVDPSDPKYMYAASQRGGFARSTDGGASFKSARPSRNDQYNWKTPYVLDPNDPTILYLGGQKVYRTSNRAVTWRAISGDLTNGTKNWNYGTITTLSVSPQDSKILWVGTDDSNVWVTTDATSDGSWVKVSEELPDRWVSCVVADPHDAQTAYITFTGIRYYDYLPHVFKTTDLGQTWQDITGDLPDFPVNNLQIDPELPNTYYLATDGGVYITTNGGENWELMAPGMPFVPVLDLNLHNPTRTLLAATFGRSMWRINLAAGTGIQTNEVADHGLKVYPNPSSEEVNIVFNLPSARQTRVEIYDLDGRLVETIHEGYLPAGQSHFQWDGRTDGKRSGGVYLCKVTTEAESQVSRVLIR